MPGHLFIVHGDLTKIACDAVLVPTGSHPGDPTRFGHVYKTWVDGFELTVSDGFLTNAVPDETTRVVRVRERISVQEPAIWAGLTGHRGDEGLSFFKKTVRKFVNSAARGASERPLLALPLVGAGAGGQAKSKGALIKEIVQSLVDLIGQAETDVVLVLNDPASYAAAQQARLRVAGSPLPGHLESRARDLAALARRDQLVLFLGAGASMDAGLPSWKDLIARLAEKAGIEPSLRAQLQNLDARDAGRLLAQRFRSKEHLADAIRELTAVPRHSLIHALAASLPVTEAVTTNYDTLFEEAWSAAGQTPAILPAAKPVLGEPWLLHLHGQLADPKTIVLSRDDYLRFEEQDVALAGLVQAMLLTRHMAFIGYSLQDDNFHRLVRQVDRALGIEEPFATSITQDEPSLREELWKDSVDFVHTSGGVSPGRSVAVFLDRVGALAAAPAAHLDDDSYKALFTEDELRLRDALSEVREVAHQLGKDNGTAQAVLDALASAGLDHPLSADGGAGRP